ncbi:hypothetical protein PUN28_020897 [Cardiocondyla obscurior]|uniref:50S ribosomal protein L20 n=1 Tax=Cardiocondyla obscurior TaxID=286306 RepID=A0AAW2E9J2_9HYME
MHTRLFRTFYFHQKPRYDMAKKRKKYFEIWQHSIVRHLKEMHTGLFRPSIFTRSRDMAKKRKKYFEIWQHNIVRHLKEMHTGLFRTFYFHQQLRYGQKTIKNIFEILQHMANERKKILLKFNNIALCGIKNRCIRAYSEFLFSSEAEIWPKTKKIF